MYKFHSMKIDEEIPNRVSGSTKAIRSKRLLLQILVLVIYRRSFAHHSVEGGISHGTIGMKIAATVKSK